MIDCRPAEVDALSAASALFSLSRRFSVSWPLAYTVASDASTAPIAMPRFASTVVETWGSAPRPVGSNLVIDDQGNFLGSVSGGCVEGAVVTEALDVIESGKPKTLEFGVADEAAWKVGLSCGGTIRVFVEKVD